MWGKPLFMRGNENRWSRSDLINVENEPVEQAFRPAISNQNKSALAAAVQVAFTSGFVGLEKVLLPISVSLVPLLRDGRANLSG
jgi:hypothetical protein